MDLWITTPDVILGNIFSYLSLVDKIHVLNCCQTWRKAAERPEVWRCFQYSESSVWEDLFEMGIPTSLEDIQIYKQMHEKILQCISYHGRCIKTIHITIRNDHSLQIFYQLCKYCRNVRNFELFSLSKEVSDLDVLRETLLDFFQNNICLNKLRTEDILNNGQKNDSLPIGLKHSAHVQNLWIINSFRNSCLSNLMYLVNLRELAITPLQLNFSLLKHLASQSLQDLYIVANSKTKDFYNEAISDLQWKDIRIHGPKLKVHCFLAVSHEWAQKEIFLKPSMPLASLVYRKNMWLKYFQSICTMLTEHRDTLTEFVDFGPTEVPYTHPSELNYDDRVDSDVINVALSCTRLTTLTVKEVLSSAAILLMVYYNRNLTELIVRADMIIYVNDLPEELFCGDLAVKHFVDSNWQKSDFPQAVCSLLGNEWHALEIPEFYMLMTQKYSKFT